MVTIKLQGGLGNQMFQYAAARARALKAREPLRLDTTWYKNSTNRRFELSSFNIPGDIIATAHKKRLSGLLSFLQPQTSDDYYQSENYFKEAENEIRKEFTLKKPLSPNAARWMERITDSPSVSVHIRRGDYLWEKHQSIFVVLPAEYYRRAAEAIAHKIAGSVFFVFSDDIGWAKENLKLPYAAEFVSDGSISAPEELMLMSACKHNVIANSSFSWWGAWLNNNPAKTVIAPKNWFIDKSREPRELIPKTWERI